MDALAVVKDSIVALADTSNWRGTARAGSNASRADQVETSDTTGADGGG